jgi:hypothetical protein
MHENPPRRVILRGVPMAPGDAPMVAAELV